MNIPIVAIENIEEVKVIYVSFQGWQYMYQKWLFSEKIEPRDAFPF